MEGNEESLVLLCPFCEKEVDYIPKLATKDGTVVHFCQHCHKILSINAGFNLESIC